MPEKKDNSDFLIDIPRFSDQSVYNQICALSLQVGNASRAIQGRWSLRRHVFIIPAAIVLAIIITALVAYLLPRALDTRLTFRVVDSVSHSWVWGMRASIDRKQISEFYQSDRGPVDLTFTHLSAGQATLRVAAANYVAQEIPLRLHIGANTLPSPVSLVGLQIPHLDHFTMVESSSPAGLSVEVRPVSDSGEAVLNHPCIDLWIGALVSRQMKGGTPATAPSNSGVTRGDHLYGGRVSWVWNADPAASFRYTATIPRADIQSAFAPYLTIDYIIIVPDPRMVDSTEIDSLMQSVSLNTNASELRAYLDAHGAGKKFRYFLSTSWNVKGL